MRRDPSSGFPGTDNIPGTTSSYCCCLMRGGSQPPQSGSPSRRRQVGRLRSAVLRKQRSFRDHVRMGQVDPLLPFKIGPVNGREAREGGLRRKAGDQIWQHRPRRAAERQPRGRRLVDRDLAAFFFRLRGFVFHPGVERLGANRFLCDPGGGRLAGFRPRANWSSLAPASPGRPPRPRPQAALARRNPVCEATCAGRRGRSSGSVPAPQNARA
jgi:hypothetical protein